FYLGSHLTGVCSLLQCFLPLRITQMWERHASSPLTGSPLTGSLFQRDLAFLFDVLDDGGSLFAGVVERPVRLIQLRQLVRRQLGKLFLVLGVFELDTRVALRVKHIG